MDFFCFWQISLAWSHLAWSLGKFPRSRSAPRPSITPTGPPNARVSTTRRTAGRPQTTPSGSGYRSVMFVYSMFIFLWRILEILATEITSHRSSFVLESDLNVCSFMEKRCSSVWTWLYRWDLAHIWSEYCSLICTTFSARYKDTEGKKKIRQHALFIEICFSCTVDMSCLHCGIWRSSRQSLKVEIECLL